jgi:hypothetical protein
MSPSGEKITCYKPGRPSAHYANVDVHAFLELLVPAVEDGLGDRALI